MSGIISALLTGLWIRIDLMRIRIRIQFLIQGFDDQKFEKSYSSKT
jgi:hypothetical protein